MGGSAQTAMLKLKMMWHRLISGMIFLITNMKPLLRLVRCLPIHNESGEKVLGCGSLYGVRGRSVCGSFGLDYPFFFLLSFFDGRTG